MTVIVVNAEVPASISEDYWTVKIADAKQPVPYSLTEQRAESHIACSTNGHVIIIVVAKSHIIKIAVDTPDIVVVDSINLINQERVSDVSSFRLF